jgi:TolB-like protein/formylglycine-generating enzyme required for sulfatase activity/dienelactone hydrolase
MSLVAELKQRKVFRVAAAYAVVGWLLVQVASVVLPALKLPEWTLTFTTILLMLGFPVALVLAWSFDVVRDRGSPGAADALRPDERSVVVLPFANMTDDAAQVHFADGLVEDILTRLQAIPWLKVISRQSAFAYKGRSVDTRTIARDLACRYVVEGSVRRIDDRVRLTAQLIDAATDQHLWAERYDRKITDAFELQDEICAEVVAAIESRLAPAAEAAGTIAEPAATAAHAMEGPVSKRPGILSHLFGNWWTVPAIVALVGMAALLTWNWQQRNRERWAHEEALPQLQALVAKDDYAGAFDLARRIAEVMPDSPQLRALAPSYSAPVQLKTDPAGAKIYFRPYESKDTDWRLIGETPLENVPAPLGVGLWRIERDGRSTALRAFRNPGAELRSVIDAALVAQFKDVDFTIPLPDSDGSPKEMVFVPATSLLVTLISDGKPVDLPAFYIDRFEVTNREFKEFVDAGGYREASNWQDLPFGGQAANWTDAVARFVDATGRPGPATWESGIYPDGSADHPVAGVSWFEAMAYARFRGKELPTAYHWYRAAYSLNEFLESISSAVVRHSNFSGKGTAPVGRYQGIGPYGTYDMAGNVREWLWTAMDRTRMIAGGAWNEHPYLYNEVDSANPWDRSPGNGFRCMRTLAGGPTAAALRSPISVNVVDFAALEPVDDATYALLEQQLRYSSADLAPRAEMVQSTNPLWRRERISLKTGYDETRFNVQLFLPTGGRPPYQTIIYLPHSGHFRYPQSSDEYDPSHTNQPLDFILKSGRAFVVIAFDGSFERRWTTSRRAAMSTTDLYRQRLSHQRQELGRTIDYLAGREDIDSSRIGWLGISLGAQALMPLLAVEPRIGAAVLVGGGIYILGVPTSEETFNYLPRVRQPVLMLNGRWDIDVNQASQEAMLRLLGTPPDRKQRVLFDVGHGWLPQQQFVRATLDWYDRYLGPTTPSEPGPR